MDNKAKGTLNRIESEEIEVRSNVREYYRYAFEFFRRSDRFVEILSTRGGEAIDVFKTVYPHESNVITFSADLDLSQPFILFKADWTAKMERAKILYKQHGLLQLFCKETNKKQTFNKWDKCLKVYDMKCELKHSGKSNPDISKVIASKLGTGTDEVSEYFSTAKKLINSAANGTFPR